MSTQVAAPPAAPRPPGPRRGGLNARHGVWSIWLIGPTIVLLAIVIGYPVVSAVIQSFQNDPGLDKATGGNAWSSLLTLAGAVIGIAYAIWMLNKRNG